MALIDNLKIWALRIKNQTEIKGNTQTLVGGLFEAIVAYLKDLSASVITMVDSLRKELLTKIEALSVGVIVRPSVPTYAQLPKNPVIGWDVLVEDQNLRYRWNGEQWVAMGTGSYDNDFAKKQSIYNLSQDKSKYDYATSLVARNAVDTKIRALGLILSYKLASGKWITENFVGDSLANWAVESNWKFIGGIAPEDIYQKVDGTIDKPISPKGVLDGITNIKGIGTPSEDTAVKNYITDKTVYRGYRITGQVESIIVSKDDYYTEYNSIDAETRCATNALGPHYFYDANKKQISYSLAKEFTTPKLSAFVRVNGNIPLLDSGSGVYVTKAPTGDATIDPDNLQVYIGVEDLNHATPAEGVMGSNIVDSSAVLAPYGLNGFSGLPHIQGLYHLVGHVRVKPSTKYACNMDTGVVTILFYDAEKNYINYVGAKEFTTPFNCFYIRFNTKVNQVSAYFVRELSASGYQVSNLYIPESHIIKDEKYGDVETLIPATQGSDIYALAGTYSYANNHILQGSMIESVGVWSEKTKTITVVIANTPSGAGAVWEKPHTVNAGYNEIAIGRKLLSGEFLCLSAPSFQWKNVDGGNPIGGGVRGSHTNDFIDMCMQVKARKPTTGGQTSLVAHYALGDSLTALRPSYVDYANNIFLADMINLAVSGIAVIGENQFIRQIRQVPTGFSGVITAMIGTNDAYGNKPLGDATATLDKEVSALTLTDNFADAFRYCLNELLTKFPNAAIIFLEPIYANGNKLPPYNEVESQICAAYNVPYHKLNCKISKYTSATYLYDGVHPLPIGSQAIAKAYMEVVLPYFITKL